MAIRKVPSAHAGPLTLDAVIKYEELLRRAERQKALAREMITTARRVSNAAIEMRRRSASSRLVSASSARRYNLAAHPSARSDSVLKSWKEIAEFMGRGVRTVQRYEKDFELPIQRLSGKLRRGVTALPQDLEAWLRNASSGKKDHDFRPLMKGTATTTHSSIKHAGELWLENCTLQNAHNEALMRFAAQLRTILDGKPSAEEPLLALPS